MFSVASQDGLHRGLTAVARQSAELSYALVDTKIARRFVDHRGLHASTRVCAVVFVSTLNCNYPLIDQSGILQSYDHIAGEHGIA